MNSNFKNTKIKDFFSINQENQENQGNQQNDFSNDYETIYSHYINVYTDGACTNNGKSNAKAGYGIYFSDNDPRNISKKIIGKQTNQVAELTAVIEVYNSLQKEIDKGEHINIYSDSIYAIRCSTTYGNKCSKKNWKNSVNNNIPNVVLVKKAFELYNNKKNIHFHHIKAHTGFKDEHSRGNEEADRLANLAIGVNPNDQNKIKKIYINVKFENKNRAKELGAKWDPKGKKWYIMENYHKKDLVLGEFSVK